MNKPRSGPSPRAVTCTLTGVLFVLAFDAVALLPLWATHVPIRWSAAVQDLDRALRVFLALASLAVLWWGLCGLHGAKAVRHDSARRWDRVILWGGVAIVLALLSFPGVFPE